MKRATVTSVLIAFVSGAAICGGGGRGHLLLANQQSIVAFDLGAEKQELVVAPVGGNGVALRDPAQSPDGRRIAYVRTASPAGANTGTSTSELWVATRDGSDPHPALQQPGVLVSQPRWIDDQNVLAIVRTSGGAGLEQMSAGTGERLAIASAVTAFDVSRKRDLVAFVRPRADGSPGLFVSAPDGSNERPLLAASQRFVAVSGLAFVPDGARIAFAASSVSPDAAHDIWTLNLTADAEPKHISTLRGPAVGLTFGADDRTLYALSDGTLSAVDVTTGALRSLMEDPDTTGITWNP